MAAEVHPTAIVEDGAELADGVQVGAFAFIGSQVRVGERTVICHHATVEGNTVLGADNVVSPYAYLGAKTQDLKYKGGDPGVRIGDGNTFREFCTVHAATNDGDFTIIGSHNYFLSYTHIAHDCIVGSHVIMSNNGTLAGHVRVQDHVVIGGLSAVHQFCNIGRNSMIGGMSKVVQDVPPYMIADGIPASVRTPNKVGLERAGYTPEQTALVRMMYKTFYRMGLNHKQAVEKLSSLPEASDPVVECFLEFVRTTERGIC